MRYLVMCRRDGPEGPERLELETREREKALRRVSELILEGYDHRTVRLEQIPTAEDVSPDMGRWEY